MRALFSNSLALRLRRREYLLRAMRSLVLISIVGLGLLLSACGDVINLRSGLSDADANEIIAALNKDGISASKVTQKEGVSLMIKSSELSRATTILQAAGLPRRNLSNLGQVFKKDGMISTPLEERIRYIHGLSEELEYTLQQFDNVITARVHVVLPERIAPGEPVQPSSAAVFIKYHRPLDEDMVTPRIRKLVASSIPGLGGEDGQSKVSVVLEPSDAPAAGIAWQELGPFMVAADSASGLRKIFGVMAVVMVLLLLLSLGLLLKEQPRVKSWWREHVGKPKSFVTEP
jgi:type III secretion protein J